MPAPDERVCQILKRVVLDAIMLHFPYDGSSLCDIYSKENCTIPHHSFSCTTPDAVPMLHRANGGSLRASCVIFKESECLGISQSLIIIELERRQFTRRIELANNGQRAEDASGPVIKMKGPR